METGSLSRRERLRLRRDFDRVFKEGKSVLEDFLRVIYVENGLDLRRMGIVVKKRLGKAHVRNRLKRLVREAFRRNKGIFPQGIDMVFVFRGDDVERVRNLKYSDVEDVLKKLAERMR